MITFEESIQSEREKLRHFLTKKELRSKVVKNPITLESIIRKYQQLHYRERYPFSTPSNLLTPNQVVEIIKSSK